METAQKCRSCGAPVVWLRTKAGKLMPVNAESVGAEDVMLDLLKHMPHFATCPDAEKWRKK